MSTGFFILLLGLGVFLAVRSAMRASSRPDEPSQSDRYNRNIRKSNIRWVGPVDEATVAGRKIGGMIYLGSGPYEETAGSPFIDPNLSVAKAGSDVSGEHIPYWPRYCDLDPRQRASYLDWLAGGRSDSKYGQGYVFLYFYGLERRFFIDSPPEEEKRRLVAETERLLSIYGESSSVRRYLGEFLDIAHIVLAPTGKSEPQFDLSCYDLPLTLRVAIGRMAKAGQPLSADWLLSWYVAHLGHSLRTPAKRAFPEFQALFKLLFDERFPKGMKMRVPKRLLHARYTSASGMFDVELDQLIGNVPDISSISKPLNDARKIIEDATNQLDKYSRFLGRNPEGRDTVEAHALLPKRLWSLLPCAGMEDLLCWATEIIEKGGLLPVEQMIERVEGVIPEKIRKQQLTGIADALARLSIGMAPDPRFALRSPRLGEPVVLFRLPEGIVELEEVGQTYKSILISIALGGFIAHADGTVTTRERGALEAKINVANVSDTERARLFANLQWMLEVPPDLTLFRRHLKEIPEDARHELGQVALAMAAVDGVIDPGEIKAIQKLYKAMGLRTEGVYSDLHALTSGNEPVTVREAGEAERDFAIPPPPAHDSKVVLDAERVSSIMANTARVSSILGGIFGDDEPEENVDETLEDGEGRFSGLDAKHSAFLEELLTQAHWAEAEFAALANQFRLMHGGALETVNEWSSEHFDDMLIDAYQGYTINQEIKAQLEY